MSGEFLGYYRADGRVGVRNHLLVLSIGGLTVATARRIGAAIAGAVTLALPYSSGLLGADREMHRHAAAALPSHPNVGATLLIGDNPARMSEAVATVSQSGKPFAALTLDDCDHDAITLTERGLRAGARMAYEISAQRRAPAPLGALMLGLECGRSDPSSGLVSNPLLGLMADAVADAGGSAVIGETTEWLGAEHLLAARARTTEVAQAILAAAAAREQAAIAFGIDLTGNNPGPTNIAAGLSSIEEKSLGNIAKSGHRPIEGVLGYGAAPALPGLWVMDAPAYAHESVTGFILAGAQMVLFTTGVGNSYVSAVAPTLKLTGNPQTAARLHEQLDFDASAAFDGRQTLDQAAPLLLQRMLDIASGSATWGEILREGDEVLARFQATL